MAYFENPGCFSHLLNRENRGVLRAFSGMDSGKRGLILTRIGCGHCNGFSSPTDFRITRIYRETGTQKPEGT
jgi:hypothetical protein